MLRGEGFSLELEKAFLSQKSDSDGSRYSSQDRYDSLGSDTFHTNRPLASFFFYEGKYV
jgi:hypothetical protein